VGAKGENEAGPGQEGKPVTVLHLEVAREGNRLKISAQERLKGEQSTILHYEEMPVSMDLLNRRCLEIVETLNKVNRRGRFTPQVLLKLRETGQIFHDELFSLDIKEKLHRTEARHLCLSIDEQLVHIPWELLNDGQRFLCQRFSMGRLVRTRQNILGSRSRNLSQPLKMLILADPCGDLEGAYAEGTQLRDDMDRRKDLIHVTLRSGSIGANTVKEKIRAFDIVHFAGHAEYHAGNSEESGWRVSDRVLTTGDIMKMAGTGAMPTLVFSNACQSARTEEWVLGNRFHNDIFGLANAFLLVGVKHYVGTFWEILDEPSSRYAVEFYRQLSAGIPVGEAMRQARMTLIKEYGEETILWASYLLYGDPAFNYIEEVKARKSEEEEQPFAINEPPVEVRTREEVIDFSERGEPRKTPRWWAVAAGVVLLAVFLVWVYPGLPTKSMGQYESQALAYFEAGDYSEAIKACKVIQEKNPKRSLGYLVLGNICFLEGDLEKANWHFRKAMEVEEGKDSEKAEALVGLGRIASTEKRTEEALKFYQQAAHLAPKSVQPYIAQGILLDREGRYGDALKTVSAAQALAPNNTTIGAFGRELKEKVAVAGNKENRERIDRLVQELLGNIDKVPQMGSDGWTSLPLTVWIMDFKSSGQSLREGEEKLIACGIMEGLLGRSRVHVVERSLLDKLLEELKLGSSRLADPSGALSLGKIMAARVILSGQIRYAGGQTQVAVRIIDTETGEVAAALNEVFASTASATIIAEKMSSGVLSKLAASYPLRGRVSGVGEKGITVNIGRKQGVEVGQLYRVVDTDSVLEITAVDSQQSTLKVKRGEGIISSGLSVEILPDG
jgi:CHAT domain-containing protein/TolA-binding protein